MNDLERSDFMFGVGVVSAAVVAVTLALFLLIAAISPEISVDIPGVSRCQGVGACSGGD